MALIVISPNNPKKAMQSIYIMRNRRLPIYYHTNIERTEELSGFPNVNFFHMSRSIFVSIFSSAEFPVPALKRGLKLLCSMCRAKSKLQLN